MDAKYLRMFSFLLSQAIIRGVASCELLLVNSASFADFNKDPSFVSISSNEHIGDREEVRKHTSSMMFISKQLTLCDLAAEGSRQQVACAHCGSGSTTERNVLNIPNQGFADFFTERFEISRTKFQFFEIIQKSIKSSKIKTN